jgi:phospholipid transport system transporter-binding protein
MSSASLEFTDDRVKIRGAIDFDTVPGLLRSASGMFARPEAKIVVDFSEIEQTKSVGLALMIEWQRQARRANKDIEFANVPKQMVAMATASGLEAILKIQPAGAATK